MLNLGQIVWPIYFINFGSKFSTYFWHKFLIFTRILVLKFWTTFRNLPIFGPKFRKPFLSFLWPQLWTIFGWIFYTYFRVTFLSQYSDQNFGASCAHKNVVNFLQRFNIAFWTKSHNNFWPKCHNNFWPKCHIILVLQLHPYLI